MNFVLDTRASASHTDGMKTTREYVTADYVACDGCGRYVLADAMVDVDGWAACVRCAEEWTALMAARPVETQEKESWM
jgi:uncharacterized paraquat-inducible protein A